MFFFANDGARAIGANAAAGAGRALRATGSSAKAPTNSAARRWVSAVLSLRHFRLARWCVLYPLAGGADDSGAAQFDRLGPPAGRIAGSFSRNRRVLFREVAAFFLASPRSFAKSPCSFSPMMELGRSARTLLPAPTERCELRGLRPRPDRFRSAPNGSPPCSLSVISSWRDGVFFIPWRGVPTIPARRSKQ